VNSNLETWKRLQEQDYFEHHECYRTPDGVLPAGGDDVAIIERYHKLGPDQDVVVVGCGYGRETSVIAPRVRRVWGIDVSERILGKASAYLSARGVGNFTPVQAEHWARDVPQGVSLFYCFIVFQHLTRDLTKAYVLGMGEKLAPGGHVVCQFAELDYGTADADPAKLTEPCVRWTPGDIAELAREAGLVLRRLDTDRIEGHGLWHWAHLEKSGESGS